MVWMVTLSPKPCRQSNRFSTGRVYLFETIKSMMQPGFDGITDILIGNQIGPPLPIGAISAAVLS